MGMFSKQEQKKMLVTAGAIPTGYELIEMVTGTGISRGAKKSLAEAKSVLQKEAAELGANGIANFKIAMSDSAGFVSVAAYGDAIKKM